MRNPTLLTGSHATMRLVVALIVGAIILPTAANAQYLKRTKRHDWLFTVDLRVHAYQERNPPPDRMPELDRFSFDQLSVVFPVIRETASSLMSNSRPESTLRFDDRVVSDTFMGVKEGYHSGARLGVWGLTGMKGRELELQVKLPVTSWRTEFDDEAAMNATWPDQWPQEAASTFEPQLFIDIGPGGDPYDMEIIEKMVDEWTNERKHKNAAPLLGAKVLVKELVTYIRTLSGFGVANNRALEMEGLELRGTPVMARSRRGNEFELVALAAAVLREADYPTRTIIAWDEGGEEEFLVKDRDAKQLRTWIEIALFNPNTNRIEWIPIDVVQIFKSEKSKLRGQYWEKPIKYFGTHDELDQVIPFAFHYHPPTSVRSYGSPGFWGWMGIPDTPIRAQQGLRFLAITQSKRSNDPNRRGGE
jgi:hypothetical protein